MKTRNIFLVVALIFAGGTISHFSACSKTIETDPVKENESAQAEENSCEGAYSDRVNYDRAMDDYWAERRRLLALERIKSHEDENVVTHYIHTATNLKNHFDESGRACVYEADGTTSSIYWNIGKVKESIEVWQGKIDWYHHNGSTLVEGLPVAGIPEVYVDSIKNISLKKGSVLSHLKEKLPDHRAGLLGPLKQMDNPQEFKKSLGYDYTEKTKEEIMNAVLELDIDPFLLDETVKYVKDYVSLDDSTKLSWLRHDSRFKEAVDYYGEEKKEILDQVILVEQRLTYHPLLKGSKNVLGVFIHPFDRTVNVPFKISSKKIKSYKGTERMISGTAKIRTPLLPLLIQTGLTYVYRSHLMIHISNSETAKKLGKSDNRILSSTVVHELRHLLDGVDYSNGNNSFFDETEIAKESARLWDARKRNEKNLLPDLNRINLTEYYDFQDGYSDALKKNNPTLNDQEIEEKTRSRYMEIRRGQLHLYGYLHSTLEKRAFKEEIRFLKKQLKLTKYQTVEIISKRSRFNQIEDVPIPNGTRKVSIPTSRWVREYLEKLYDEVN